MSRLWELRAELRHTKALLSEYEDREDVLRRLLRDIGENMGCHGAAVNGRITELVRHGNSGFGYFPYITGSVVPALENKREGGPYSDGRLCSIQDEINEELRATRRRIAELECEISSLNRAISREKEREENMERNARTKG